LAYDPGMIRFNIQFLGKFKGSAPYTFFRPTDEARQEIFSLITSIRHYMFTLGKQSHAYRMNHAFSMLLSHVVEPMLPPDAFKRAVPKNNRLPQLIEIEQFFFNRYAEPITILDLAAALNYSETQARRILQEYTGKSFADNLRHHRITAAKQYLLNSNFSIDEIAERCGFSSVYHFCRAFRTATGITPTEHRKKERY
jgi:AraC-like DNA-binding protein